MQKTNTCDGIDEELYSRQLYVLGYEAMKKMQKATVLIVGADGLGQEIAKNVILAGISKVGIYDNESVAMRDLGAGFYFKEDSVGENRVDAILGSLKAINSYVEVDAESGELDSALASYNIVVSVNKALDYNLKLSKKCREAGLKFVVANSRGFFVQLFVDFNIHVCYDKTGAVASAGMINHITAQKSDKQLLVVLADGAKHSLEEEDTIKITKDGTSEFYARIKNIKNRSEFVVECDTPFVPAEKAFYEFEQIKTAVEIFHEPLEKAMKMPGKNVKHEYSYEDNLHSLFMGQNVDDKELKNEFDWSNETLLAPVCSVLGGFAAQEVIKGASGKFMPLNQFFYFHCAGLFNKDAVKQQRPSTPTRYSDYVKLLGESEFNKLKGTRLFLVGAGAIGCENIKNFVMTGIGSSGMIYVTDMDSIEKSNLNRQFLFKADDVGKVKSESACRRVLEMNGEYADSLKAYTIPVKEETENVFSDCFFEGLDVVSNALDNVQARTYIDERCVQHCRGMVDAGTLGTKGHVQVVVPHLTESYGSTTDPEETSIPLCTIRSYPNSIDHTIEWALAEFKSEFSESKDDVSINSQLSLIKLTEYAVSLFDLHFNKTVAKLLATFPPDHVTAEGVSFWLPPKRIPRPIRFDASDPLHLGFVLATVRLYCEANDVSFSHEAVESLAQDVRLVDFDHEKEALAKKHLVEFEKDSDHADFVYAAANLRARNYEIKEQTKHFITGVAGKIIPAIATTTAMVSGLGTFEIMKYVLQKKEVRNSFLDLAHPMYAAADPIDCTKNTYKKDGSVVTYTLWSRLKIKDRPLGEMVDELSRCYGDRVTDVSAGARILYMEAMPKFNKNLEKTVSELVGCVDGQKYIWINAMTEDEIDKELVQVELNR
ncbi:UBA1 [Enterospora canceri]|uniref:UBA1 n=1 Tax=Enterospora canceri TaxID=1081671 RepID=A0A1Y1S7T3_9MICR|nr:UBA1 [Enterospora canceri]